MPSPTHVLAVAPLGVGETVVSGSLAIAIPLAVLAGLVSFASPCVLPLVPGYLSYVTGLTGTGLGPAGSAAAPGAAPTAGAPGSPAPTAGARGAPGSPAPAAGPTPAAATLTASERPAAPPRARVALGTLLFIAGFSAVFVSYGALFGGLGATLLEHQDVLTRVLGAIVIVLGLGFLGLVPTLQREARLHRRPARGLWGAPLLGALFGLGWTPCIGPTLAAVQGLAFSEASAARGALLSVAYCLGLGLPFLLVGLAMERGLGAMAWARRHARTIQVVGGACLVVLGLLMVSGVWGSLMNEARGWVTGFEVPL
ncbi:MAG: cytochrome c biogenesis protein CcdA [Candidatus Nanopelagicales bacterium]|jgi:cytochrome c-type biogenesis protein|nr:cytochrome c biogenesis protein CcdA [Candidatus Nanopelagicales bacterium]